VTERLLIVLWACGPDRPGGPVLAAAPFVYALAARALEIEVELHFTSSAVRWLLEGVADGAHTDHAMTRTVREYLDEVKAAGVPLYACAMALAEHRGDGERLIDGVKMAGAATVVGAAMQPGLRVMTF
jgi:predicted peroxiredoxin